MRLSTVLKAPLVGLSVLAVVVGVSALAWASLSGTQPVITAYCKVEGFAERPYASFAACQASLSSDIQKYGNVCSCGRTDGLFRPITALAQWLF